MADSAHIDNAKPLVSVYCMTYNQESVIADAIEGVLAQKTDFPFELIIHDDASTDGTADIVKSYAEKYPEIIHPIYQKVNQYGKCNFYKEFFNPKALGDYIAICEGDDFWVDPFKLQRQVDCMRSHPDCTMCFHAVKQLNADGSEVTVRPLKSTGEVDPQLIVKRGGMFCPTVSLMLRRDVMFSWPEFRLSADVYDYPLQVLAASLGSVHYIDECMAVYRFGADGSWTAEHVDSVDYTHVENEIGWITQFDEYTAHRFSHSVNFHIVHMWFTEFRKSFDRDIKLKAKPYISHLTFKNKVMFKILFFGFSVFGKGLNRLWQAFKYKSLK